MRELPNPKTKKRDHNDSAADAVAWPIKRPDISVSEKRISTARDNFRYLFYKKNIQQSQ
ncbi:hypothetical protein [Syntrophus aciditrophicus]|uniref:Hypothetical cytosolic protein n=1 Tax=Syntrophus aciditrophicus (strain SB) TaxID=56780 RepID=Q2LXT1_SYNAS|nr:hypothetical protein [Syntrophus aciditrophicus]ABC78889.1 hypothetical cytosolic protein [Syntrophus aciditrophicus SB]